MTDTELHKILAELRSLPGETEIVEFKEAKENYDFNKLGKYFSALSNEANLKGKPQAWLLFGIENSQRNIVGSNYRAGNRPYLDSLKSEIANKTTNRITFIEIHELEQPEGRVVLFQIPAAPQGIPIAWEGHYYGRDGEELAPFNLEKIDRIRRQIASLDWSAEPYPRATLADLDADKIKKFIKIAQKERGFPLSPDTAIEDVMAHLKLMQDGKICNAALLAFGKQPQQFFTTAITKCARFHGLIVEKPIPAHKVFHGDVFEQVDAAVDFILSKIDVSVGMRTESNQAPIRYELPRSVVIEAIVNAIAHRDYTSNASVQVMLFKDRLKVFNPGYLTPRLSVQQLKSEHPSYPTNPMLAELMYLAGYIERFGTGTGEIYRLTKKAGLKEPEFDFTGGFNIIIWRPKKSAAPAAPKYPTSTPQVSPKYPTTQEVRQVISVFDGDMKRLQIQEFLELKDRKSFLKNYLQPALIGGFIEMTIPEKPNSSKQSYRLTEKGQQLQKILKKTIKGTKIMNPYRKLIVYAVNELLRQNKISLSTEKEYNRESEEKEKGHLFTSICNYPAVIIWRNIGYQELTISVWWKYDHDHHPQANLEGNARENFQTSEPLAKRSKYKNFVGVTVSGWLERKNGKYIQGKGREGLFDIYSRDGEKSILDALPTPKPTGYLSEGKVHL